MNCREINHALDSKAPDTLAETQRQSIDRHLAACETCAEEWVNYRDMAALSIPTTPAHLAARIAAALPQQDAPRPRQRQRYWIGAGLLVAGLAGAGLSLWRGPDAPDEDSARIAISAEPAIAVPAATEPAPAATGATSDSFAADALAGPEPTPSSSPEIALDRLSIAVFARPETAAGALEVTEVMNCHDAIVRQLRAIGGLNVVAGASVAAFDDSGLSDAQIARQLGAGTRLLVGTTNGCNARLSDTQTGERLVGHTYAGASMPPVDGWNSFARGFAMSVREVMLEDPAAIFAEARAMLLNTALDDYQRIGALNEFRADGEPMIDEYDSTVIMVAAEIGMSSSSAEARRSAWVGLRGIDEAYLIEPLLRSLANDPDDTVRMQAAISLNIFLDKPGVRDALARSAAQDPASVPAFPCCIPTVREAAEWASKATAELPGWGRMTLLDESLPARSRLAPISMGYPDRRQLLLSDLGDDAPNVVFDIGRREQDPIVRQMAWRLLAQSPRNDDFTAVLSDDVANHPDEYVRSSAAMTLSRYSDDPAVRETLERALDDPSMAVRRNATIALGR